MTAASRGESLRARVWRHVTRLDLAAAGIAAALLLAGAASHPIRSRVAPREAMHAMWSAHYRGPYSHRWGCAWADAPPGYPHNQRVSSAPVERFRSEEDHTSDLWGNPWWLEVSWETRTWAVLSAGPDGRIGAESDNIEIFRKPFEGGGFLEHDGLELDLLLYELAALWAWLYGVVRCARLPALDWRAEVVRAVVVVSPFSALCFRLIAATREAIWLRQLPTLAPPIVAITATASFAAVLLVLGSRLRGRGAAQE